MDATTKSEHQDREMSGTGQEKALGLSTESSMT